MAITPALTALFNQVIAGTATLYAWRLYTITSVSAGALRFADSDFDVKAVSTNPSVNGFLYTSSTLRIDAKDSKTQAHFKVGLDTDQYVLVVMPRPFDVITGAAFPDTIGSVPWLQAASGGALEGADFQVDEAYFSALPTWPMPAGGAQPVGCKTIFKGIVGEIDTTNAIAVITANDYRSLLTIQMPRREYAGQCRHNLFGPGCNADGLSRAQFAQNGAVGAGSTRAQIIAVNLARPGGSGTYALGSIQMTSGLNAGFSRTITNWDGANTIMLLRPFPFTLVAGDTFSIAPGCNWTQPACAAFGNSNNFGGESNIPAPEVVGT